VRSATALALVAALALGAGACTPTPRPVQLTEAWPGQPGSYDEVNRAWTRRATLRGTYQQVLEVYATFRAPEWRAAHAGLALGGVEKRPEAVERAVAEAVQHLGHALAHAQRVALDRVAAEQLGALEHVVQGQQHLAQFDRRRQFDRRAIRYEGIGRGRIAIQTGPGLEVFGGQALEP